MKFFPMLPKVYYDNNLYYIRNLFWKYYFETPIPSEYLYNYRMNDGDSLESLSFMEYDDTQYWWLLALINDIRDPVYELPLENETLQEIAKDLATTDSVLDMTEYVTQYDILEAENDGKRNIKILKADYLNKVITDIIKNME